MYVAIAIAICRSNKEQKYVLKFQVYSIISHTKYTSYVASYSICNTYISSGWFNSIMNKQQIKVLHYIPS